MTRLERIARIEKAAADSLPCAESAVLDGWRLRFNHGVARRANSVLAEASGNLPLERKLELAEAFYRKRRLPPRFQLCPASQPPELEGLLEGRGYRRDGAVAVETATPAAVLAATASADPWRVRIRAEPWSGWFGPYREAEHLAQEQAEVRSRMFARLGSSAAFLLLSQGEIPVALGLGVQQGGLVGIFNMVTLPLFRGRGAAAAVLHELAGWARARGAELLYLQVAEDNDPARRAYRRAAFVTFYHYHYRVFA